MNSYTESLIKEALKLRKFDVISEASRIVNPVSETKNNSLVLEQYSGDGVRVFRNKSGGVSVLCPKEITVTESEYLAHAITTGDIFDDADRVNDAATYTVMTTLPIDTITRQDIESPMKPMLPVVGATIGRVNDAGCVDCDETDMKNGYAITKDMVTSGSSGNDVRGIVKNYIDIKDDNENLPMSIANNMYDVKQALKELEDFDDDDIMPDEDIVDYEIGDDDSTGEEDGSDIPVEEGFLSKKPKKLKPIPTRDIISYITIEMNAIQDTNDQAMLSGYTCSKLEVADFYLSCIDTNDERYIVPHTRQFIVQYQNDLNRLLTQILKIKPVNKGDRVWKVDVNYPDGWRG